MLEYSLKRKIVEGEHFRTLEVKITKKVASWHSLWTLFPLFIVKKSVYKSCDQHLKLQSYKQKKTEIKLFTAQNKKTKHSPLVCRHYPA